MELDTPLINFEIRDNILVCTYKNGLSIDLEIAKKIVSSRLSFAGDLNRPAMILTDGVMNIDKPAREFLSSDKGIHGLTAAAIVVNSVFGRFMGNFFLAVNKSKIPVKIFENDSKARDWLTKF